MDPNTSLHINAQTPTDIGRLARAVRIAQRIRANEFSLNHQTVQAIENGSDTVRVGNVLKYLRELGVRIHLELPPGLTPDQLDKPRMRVPRATL